MFEKTYELSLNKNYVSHWGLAEAVRELLQNALDSESPFVYEFAEDDEGFTTLHLRSEFTTLSPQTLLLGSTSKAGAADFIGNFGEGYKIALLVLTRLGHKVTLDNGDKLWTPKFKYSSKFEEDLLVIQETSLPYRNKGLRFSVAGLDDDAVGSIVDSCLQMQKHVGELKETSKGDILLERPGKLYVGGLYICDTELQYGYNIKPQYLKLERDRQTVSNFDLKFVTKDMWLQTGEYDRIAGMIEEEVPDLEYIEYGSPEVLKDACYKLFREKYPGAVVAKNQTELKALVEKGMERVVVLGGGFYSQISSSRHYKAETYVAVVSVELQMKQWLAKNRSEMRTNAIIAFKGLIEESKGWVRK